MPMPRIAKPARPLQLDLFQEPPTTPTWHLLPAEVQVKTRELLTRLFRAHRLARPDVARDQEVRDE
jgi:hypothetical protein